MLNDNITYGCCTKHVENGDGDKLILHWVDSDLSRTSYTYSYFERESNRVAQVLRALGINPGDTVSIFIPLSFLTGLYGMNFDRQASPWNMPELRARFGYPVFLAFVLAIGIFQLVLYWRRGWFSKVIRGPVAPPSRRDEDAQ